MNPQLRTLRRQIDRLDQRLLSLLNRRARLALRVGALKHRNGRQVFDPKREREILARLRAANAGPLPAAAIAAIYREILKRSRQLERRG